MNDLPARLDVRLTAKVLGFEPHDIPVLVRARTLKPLGNPQPNSPKYFARCEIEQKASDIQWLDRATRVLAEYWRRKNSRRHTINADSP
jgi:hypothetical protein